MAEKKRELDSANEGLPDAKRAKYDHLEELLKKHTNIDVVSITDIINSKDVKQANTLYYQLLLQTTNKAKRLWRRVVVHGGMNVSNLIRLIELIIKVESAAKEIKFTSHDGKEVKPRGALSPAKTSICQLSGLPGNKFSMTYKDYSFEVIVEKVALAKEIRDSFVPRCVGGGGTLATCKNDLKAGAKAGEPDPFDIKHPNRHIVRTRFGANPSKNATPRELPAFIMLKNSTNEDYWHIVDTQMSKELN